MVAIFALIVLVQMLSIAISAVFLNESHKGEMFADLEHYAKSFGKSLNLQSNALLAKDSHYRISVIDLNGNVIFDNKFDIKTLDNHLEREEVQNLLQNKSPKAVRLSDSEHKENLYFARFIANNGESSESKKIAKSGDSGESHRESTESKKSAESTKSINSIKSTKPQNLILRVSTDKDSLFSYLQNFMPLFITLLLFSAIISIILGIFLTYKILNPIKNINLSHPIKTNPYAELHIFMQQISKQKKKIKKQLKSIKQSKLQFDIITKNMNEGFLVLDSTGNITQSNAKAMQILRLTPYNRHINIFALMSDFTHAIKESIDSSNQTFEISINEYFLQVICMPIFIKDRLKAIIILLFDKSLQKDIFELRKEFSENVTHELKTPLSAILASSEMLCNGLVLDKDRDEFIARIYSESKRLLTLIDKILKISFLDSSLERSANCPQKERVNLSNLIANILPNLQNLAKDKDIKIYFENLGSRDLRFANLDSKEMQSLDLPITNRDLEKSQDFEVQNFEVLGIPALLEDMVYNLSENAIKYSPKGSQVAITLKSDKNSAILSIRDNGIGIAPSEQERVFERFYCIDKSRSKKLGGNGLGLAIVKRVAKINNAQITLNSELGKGSEFVITFAKVANL